MDATSLIKGIQAFLNFGNVKTSPIMHDEKELDKKVSINAMIKDDDGIFKNFHITIEETVPPSDPEAYIKKSELYKTLFD